jgi:hypothetical protein
MAEDRANRGQRDALAEPMRGRGMAEDVRAMSGAVDLGTVECTGGNCGHGFRAEGAERGHGGEQHRRTGEARTMVGRRGEDRLPHLLRQGEACLAPVLPGPAERAVLPRDIVPLSGRDLAGAEP